MQKIDLRLPNLRKIYTGNVGFWGEEKTGLLGKKELPKQGREPTVNSALKTRHLLGFEPRLSLQMNHKRNPNIQVQILQSDLHTFPLRIS